MTTMWSRWSELSHAYGEAGDVPELLDQLSDGNASVMDDLVGSLWHQGTAYSASLRRGSAILPTSRGAREAGVRVDILILIGSIAASTDRAPMPEDLRAEYQAALPIALELALKTLSEPIDPSDAVYLLAMAAGLDGRTAVGRVLDVDSSPRNSCSSARAATSSFTYGRKGTGSQPPPRTP